MTLTVTTTAFPRFGLAGNPSDGYGGCILATTFRNFVAEVIVAPSDTVSIRAAQGEPYTAASLEDLLQRCARDGHPAKHRLMTATACRMARTQAVDRTRGFALDYRSTIPREVGLAGSSALVVAALRALSTLFDVTLETDSLIDLALRTETEELKIAGGLMDRTIQVLEGALFFDCSAHSVTASARWIDPAALPNLYLAYNGSLARESGAIHNDVKARYESGDAKVHGVMRDLRALAEDAYDRIVSGQGGELAPLIDRNYDLRASIFDIDPRYEQMIRTARAAGASAKFAGSGGAVVGTYHDDDMLNHLREKFAAIGSTLIRPELG